MQLQQVFMNLMLNGIDAMKETSGGSELTIKSKVDDGQLLISVSDTGVGLPPGQSDLIFSAFFTTKDNGTGMGLPISRSIIESHGGRLWAAGTPGRNFSVHTACHGCGALITSPSALVGPSSANWLDHSYLVDAAAGQVHAAVGGSCHVPHGSASRRNFCTRKFFRFRIEADERIWSYAGLAVPNHAVWSDCNSIRIGSGTARRRPQLDCA
jgi:signal transduction histidine kinase